RRRPERTRSGREAGRARTVDRRAVVPPLRRPRRRDLAGGPVQPALPPAERRPLPLVVAVGGGRRGSASHQQPLIEPPGPRAAGQAAGPRLVVASASTGAVRAGAVTRRCQPGEPAYHGPNGTGSKGDDAMAVITGRDEQLLIGGNRTGSESGDTFDVVNPANGEVVGSVPDGSAADVDAAIDAAAGALERWRSTPALERGRVLRRAADTIRERKDEIAAVMTAEQGKPLAEATGEVEYAAGFLEWFGGEAERVYGELVPSANAANRVLVMRQPVGVAAAITPWN